jgi:transposase
MLTVDDYGRIRRAHRDGMSIREMARKFHHSRQKIRKILHGGHRVWRRWLSRRHRKRKLDWDKFNRLLERFPLPPLRVVHSVVRHREANV